MHRRGSDTRYAGDFALAESSGPKRLQRCVSQPDMGAWKQAWDAYQNRVPLSLLPAQLQLDLLDICTDIPLTCPRMRVKMGFAEYFTAYSTSSQGLWNEGFLFTVSYHAQLFNTIELDLYDLTRKRWPKKTRHVAKAKLKLSSLCRRPDQFVTFLPLYEYHSYRTLPGDLLESVIGTDAIQKHMTPFKSKLIGSVQVRVRYRYQHADDIDRLYRSSMEQIHGSKSISDQVFQQKVDGHELPPSPTQAVPWVSENTSLYQTPSQPQSQHGFGNKARDENYIDHVFMDRLNTLLATSVPTSKTSQEPTTHGNAHTYHNQDHHKSVHHKSTHHVRRSSSRRAKRRRRFRYFFPARHQKSSSRGRRYGFSQRDTSGNKDSHASTKVTPAPSRNRLKRGAKKAQYIISSMNFGDRNFAVQWLRTTFDDVASSHPLMDRLVGMVVRRQTRALVRYIMSLANAFGQGFKVTMLRLVKSLILLQRYHQSIRKQAMGPEVKDQHLIYEGCHYFNYALIAYGWRGLLYLGAYGQYIRGAQHARSNRYAIIQYLSIHPEDLLGYEYGLRRGAAFQPSYFVAVDRRQKNIVLSIRGTWSLYDAITDLVCDYTPYKQGLVHSGMLASAQWFFTHIVPQIFLYVSRHRESITSFIITGHSLGGGTASMLTMMVADHMDNLRSLADNPNFRLHCYSYAPVALTSLDLGEKYSEYIHSFIVQDDIVGRLSYGTAMKLREQVLDTVSACDTLGGFFRVWTDATAFKAYCDILDRRRAQMNKSNDPVYPVLAIPGTVIHIQRSRILWGKQVDKKKKKARFSHKRVTKHLPGASRIHFTAHYATSALSNEMILTKTCLEDHIISTYQEAIDKLRANNPAP